MDKMSRQEHNTSIPEPSKIRFATFQMIEHFQMKFRHPGRKISRESEFPEISRNDFRRNIGECYRFKASQATHKKTRVDAPIIDRSSLAIRQGYL
jgi:hypothetical protein